jgi:hypothetical protein
LKKQWQDLFDYKPYCPNWKPTRTNKDCVALWALPFTLKNNYLKAKEEELWKLKYLFHHAKNYNPKKIL